MKLQDKLRRFDSAMASRDRPTQTAQSRPAVHKSKPTVQATQPQPTRPIQATHQTQATQPTQATEHIQAAMTTAVQEHNAALEGKPVAKKPAQIVERRADNVDWQKQMTAAAEKQNRAVK